MGTQPKTFVSADAVKAGDVLIADSGFTCLLKGEAVTVKADGGGHLYVPCTEGSHYLDGQLSEGRYVGLTSSERHP